MRQSNNNNTKQKPKQGSWNFNAEGENQYSNRKRSDLNECCAKKAKLDPPTPELAFKFEIGTPDLGSSKLKW